MNTLDYIIMAFLAVGFIYGYFKGIIKQATLGAGTALGLLLAVLYHSAASGWLECRTGWSVFLTIPIGFLLIVLCVILVFKIIGVILSWLMKLVHLAFIDKAVGALFSLFVALFLFTAVVKATDLLCPDNGYTGKTMQQNSLLYKHTKIITSAIIDKAEKKINEKKQ